MCFDDSFLIARYFFTILCWFLPYISMNQPQVYICPLSLEPPSRLPPHPTSLGCHRALDCSLCHTADSHWLCILHMVMYMFPCYCLSSSHPLPPTLYPQVSSLCLHLYCCSANRFINTIFLDSIHMR